ncbi:MAG: hypothetical protein ACOYMG_11100 [Candidatus Methylumidiphilus sp.]
MVFRFDGESLRTLQHPLDFALEVDVAEIGGNRLRFNEVRTTFPVSAQPMVDTSLSDSSNGMGVRVIHLQDLKPNIPYYVYFILKDPLPPDGVAIDPTFQITANTGIVSTAVRVASPMLPPVATALFDLAAFLTPALIDQYQYFVLQTDGYVNKNDKKELDFPWRVYPDGHEGVCWTSKQGSFVCDQNQQFVRGPSVSRTETVSLPSFQNGQNTAATAIPPQASTPTGNPSAKTNLTGHPKVSDNTGRGYAEGSYIPSGVPLTLEAIVDVTNGNAALGITGSDPYVKVRWEVNYGSGWKQVGEDQKIHKDKLTKGTRRSVFWDYTISANLPNGSSFRTRCTVDFKNIVIEKYESDNVKEEAYRVAAATPVIQPVTSYPAPTNAQKAALRVVQDLLLND